MLVNFSAIEFSPWASEASIMVKKKSGYDFEQSLSNLESLVERMESGQLSLEESLQAFEQGIRLTRECQSMLAEAEQKVQILTQQQGSLAATPFEPDTGPAASE